MAVARKPADTPRRLLSRQVLFYAAVALSFSCVMLVVGADGDSVDNLAADVGRAAHDFSFV